MYSVHSLQNIRAGFKQLLFGPAHLNLKFVNGFLI